MEKDSSDIWTGDKLERKAEAEVLENFLVNETKVLREAGRDQSLVLALDAPYGEGKTWFLERFRLQLEENHTVAFVDAWSDDSGNQPLVAITAAVEDAIQPHLKVSKIKDKLGELTLAAAPLIGKAALGAGGRFVAKYIGDQFADDAKDLATTTSKSLQKNASHAAEDGTSILADEISQIVDSAGKKLLKQYRKNRESRDVFKASLKALAASFDGAEKTPASPIFVIVDELDRCRPDYAISLLEEIKHLFDVPGIVFVIALHGEQLNHSINAVYGPEFDSRAYLRRFFTRTYKLRKLSMRELVNSRFSAIDKPDKFCSPAVLEGTELRDPAPSDLAGDLLTEWNVTAREAISTIDGLRLFSNNWEHNLPIELPLVLHLLVRTVRNLPLRWDVEGFGPTVVRFAFRGSRDRYPSQTPNLQEQPSNQLILQYSKVFGQTLSHYGSTDEIVGIDGYIDLRMKEELRVTGNTHVRPGIPEKKSIWTEYQDRIDKVGRFIEQNPAKDRDGTGPVHNI